MPPPGPGHRRQRRRPAGTVVRGRRQSCGPCAYYNALLQNHGFGRFWPGDGFVSPIPGACLMQRDQKGCGRKIGGTRGMPDAWRLAGMAGFVSCGYPGLAASAPRVAPRGVKACKSCQSRSRTPPPVPVCGLAARERRLALLAACSTLAPRFSDHPAAAFSFGRDGSSELAFARRNDCGSSRTCLVHNAWPPGSVAGGLAPASASPTI